MITRISDFISMNESHDYSDIFAKLDSFIASPKKNEYISDGNITVYVRKSSRVPEGEMLEFLDIANIGVERQNAGTGKGFFTELLKRYPNTNIFVESILNPAIEHILNGLGFKQVRHYEINQSMYILRN